MAYLIRHIAPWRRGRIATVVALVLGAVLNPASAMTYRHLKTEDGEALIEAAGPIGYGDGARFQNFLDWLPSGTVPVAVSVDSTGGSVAEAADIAQAIQSRGLAVAVIGSHTCASACFLLFAAAPFRIVGPNALVGVHSASQGGQETIASMAFTTMMAREAKALHVPPGIIGKMVTTAPDDMSWLSVADLRGMDVTLLTDDQSRKLQTASASPGSQSALTSPAEPTRPRSPSPASAGSSMLEQRATDFIGEYFRTWSSESTTANGFVVRAYAPTVQFYGKPTTSQAIVAAKQAYILRWPIRSYRLRAEANLTACEADGTTCTVSGIVDWECRSPQRNAQSSGIATFSFRVDMSSSRVTIVSETGSVIGRGS